jgi:hypothetical protein
MTILRPTRDASGTPQPAHGIDQNRAAMIRSRTNEHPRLALLIGALHDGDLAIHNDLTAMYAALQRRGLAPDEVLTLEGKLDRQILMSFLSGARRRIAHWTEGELFLYLSGHGFFTGDTVEEAEVGVRLQNAAEPSAAQESSDHCVYWTEIFDALAVPEAVTLTLLADH